MAQVTRDIIQLKKSKTGDVFYPETHMQAVIGLNGNKDAKTVLAGPISGSAGPASFRPLYPTDIIPLFTKEYTYKCTANDTNNGNIYFMNVTPTSDDWATPWSVHYTLQVDCLTSEDANSKYCHGFYDIYVGSAGSNYYYHVFNTFYSSSYYPVYYHKLLYHNTEAKYTNYHITNPVKLGARIQSAWGANTRTRIYSIKVYDYKNCTISFPENIEIYGDVYRDTYYNTIDWNATSTGLQETSDQNDTTTMNLYYTRLQAGTNGIKQSSLVMQDKNGKWQSFTKGAGGTATTKEKNDAEFRLGSRIYRIGRSSDLGADEYLGNGQVQAYYGLVDLRYSLNITSNNSATGGSVGLTQYKPVYIVGTINSNGYFVLDDIWWTQDEPITEDGKIYIRVIDSVYLDNPNNPNGQYRGDLISDGNAYYYKNGSFQRYIIADSANSVPWSGVTGRPSFYDLVIKASDATTLLTYKPTTSGTYQLTLNKSNIGLGNVENTALSTWIGSNKITTVGTITSGTWNGSTIAIGKGGTGLTTYTKGDMLYASTNNTLAKLGANTGTKKFLSMASSVPSWEVLATTDLPAMYIGKTAVKFENTTEQALTGISTGAFSSSITVGNGSTPVSNEQASTTQKRRIYFGSSNYYIEVDKNGYLHTNVGFYSDSFVSAGGLSNAGGSSGIDSDALWELLAASTSEQINSSHLPKGSAADLTSGTSTTGVAWGAKTIADYVTSQINTSISSALYFRGQSTTAITNGGTETATINGHTLVAKTGDLVLYNGKEFAWDGSHWIQFGDESSWASKNISISTSGYLTGGGDLTTSRTISINTNKISDSAAASSLSSTSTNLVTERDIYYGLPTINNSHAYTSGTTIYAPTSAGTANQVLLSGGANTAPTWGNASGLSVGTASKLGSSTVGSTTKPIYLSSGTATECNTYAGGTAVTLNGTSKAASTASFYAPTGAGTNGYVLKSNGSGEPSWVAQSTLSVGTASKLGSATVGSTNLPIYLNAGTPTAITKLLTTSLEEPTYVAGGITLTTLSLVNTTAPNRLVFLPADQVIIEQTTDGGVTWVSAGASDDQKRKLFAGNTQSGGISIPKINGEKNKLCGIRITITGMKYNVPTGTAEADKYAYWNKDNVASTERYVSLEGLYIWLNAGPDCLKTRIYRATGANPNTWVSADSGSDMPLTGWTGGNYILLPARATFGGGTTQTGNYWNYRFVFFTEGTNGGDLSPGSITSGQSIDRIQGFGRNGWTLPNNLMKLNHIYDWDVNQNAIFPAGADFKDNIILANNKGIYIKDSTAVNKSVVEYTSVNTLYFGYGNVSANRVTNICGNSIKLNYGTSRTTGITLDSTGAVAIAGNTTVGGTLTVSNKTYLYSSVNITGAGDYSEGIRLHHVSGLSSIWFGAVNNNGYDAGMWGITVSSNGMRFRGPASTTATSANDYINILHGGNVGINNTNPAYKLAVGGTFNATGLSTLSGGISLGTQYTPSGASSAVDSKLVWDDTNKAWHLIGNFYADGFISAGGLSNSSGGGGVDIDAVWASLTNSVTDEYASTRIAQSHLPAISSSGSGVVSAIAYSGSGNSLVLSVTKTAVVTSLGAKTGAITLSGGLSIDSNNVLSSTDNKVTQTATTTSAAYELLFSATADNTTRTEGARKTSTLTYNPSTKALLTGGTVDGLTLAPQATGFKISGGTTSRTLTVGANYTLGAACAKGVTDNSSATAVTSSDTNLITARTLYYAGYVKSSGVTSITLTSGTGITVSDSGTAITSTGSRTISLNVSGAKTALGLGTMAYEAKADYVLLATAQTISAKHTFSNGILLNTASSWTSSDRAIAFSADGEDANIRYYSTDSSKGLTFNPNTGELKAAKFTRRGGTSSQFLKADGSVDSSSYITGITSLMVTTALGYTPVTNARTVNGKALSSNITLSLDDVADGSTRKLANYLPLAGGTMTGNLKWGSSTALPSTTSTSYILCIDAFADGGTTKYISTSNLLGGYVKKAGDTMSGNLAICLTPNSSYPVDRTKANLIIEDDNEAATGEILGGNIIISRGYSATANKSAGAISFYGRRLSGGYRNGVRIASIASVTGTSYDKQDLAFYVSNNESDSTPTFEEAMRIRADKAVSMNGWLSISRGGVYNIYTNNTASDGTASGIRFQLNGTTKGGLFVSSDENLYYSVGTASTGNKVLTSANYDSFALPLAGGTMTGSIKLPNGSYINAASGYTMCGIGSGGETFYCGPGSEITNAFYIRSGNINLTHVKAGTNYTIWDASNSGISTMPWACSTLSVNTSLTLPNNVSILGTLTDSTTASMIKMSTSNNIVIGNSSFAHNVNLYGTLVNFYAGGTTAIGTVSSTGLEVTGTVTASGIGTFDRVVLSNSGAVSHIEFTRAGWNYVSVPTDGVIAFNTGGSGSANTSMAVTPDGIRPGTKAVHSCGLPTAYWGNIYGQDLYLGGDAYNTAAGSIIFSEKLSDQRNGFKIAPVHAAAANRVNLVFYRSNVGSSPYAPSWTTFMTLSYDGKVTIAGSLTTSGDQVISSDATLKTNWKELNYTVKDIANVKIGIFDWKDGHGTSAGSVAQDWKKLIPELVHGDEGNMTLAYGQIALLNTVLLARHEDEQDKEIKELKERIKELEDKVKQLTTN